VRSECQTFIGMSRCWSTAATGGLRLFFTGNEIDGAVGALSASTKSISVSSWISSRPGHVGQRFRLPTFQIRIAPGDKHAGGTAQSYEYLQSEGRQRDPSGCVARISGLLRRREVLRRRRPQPRVAGLKRARVAPATYGYISAAMSKPESRRLELCELTFFQYLPQRGIARST